MSTPQRGKTSPESNAGSFKSHAHSAPGATAALDPDVAAPDQLDRNELRRAWDLERELLILNDPAETLDMPAGYTCEVVPDSDDPGTLDGTGLIEKGQYVARQYDEDGAETDSFMLHHFDDLPARREAAFEVARKAVLKDRDTQGPPSKAYLAEARAAAAALEPDPYEDFADEDPLAEARAEARAEREYERQYVDDPDSFWHGAEILHAYTRADALKDGTLIDFSATAREAGIVWPVALTPAAHADCVAWKDSNAGLQDESGRAWDVAWMASRAIKAHAQRNPHGSPGDRVPFRLARVPNTPRATTARTTELHAILTAGDSGEPCWTITLPHED